MIVAALLLQAAPVAAATPTTRASAAPPQRFSILASPCPPRRSDEEVVVCGDGASAQRLPLPAEAEPTPGYVKPDSMDYRDNKGGAKPCSVGFDGCTVGFGPPIMPIIAAGIKGVKGALQDRREAAARRRDGARRVPIDLAGPAPQGRLTP